MAMHIDLSEEQLAHRVMRKMGKEDYMNKVFLKPLEVALKDKNALKLQKQNQKTRLFRRLLSKNES